MHYFDTFLRKKSDPKRLVSNRINQRINNLVLMFAVAVATTIVVAAFTVRALTVMGVLMLAAGRLHVALESTCKQSGYCIIGCAGDAGEQLNAILLKSADCAIANAAANDTVDVVRDKQIKHDAMAAAGGIDSLCAH